ncbi:MAG TPA: hypothetical protein ENH82_09195 [bacterium]|nr:hypothetical protein [bacterium]
MIRYDKENLILIGISYKTAPVDNREKFSFSKETISNALNDIKRIHGVSECVILSTCNRTELYIFADRSSDEVSESIYEYILNTSGMKKDFLRLSTGAVLYEIPIRIKFSLSYLIIFSCPGKI